MNARVRNIEEKFAFANDIGYIISFFETAPARNGLKINGVE
jgi:hypothetical protein